MGGSVASGEKGLQLETRGTGPLPEIVCDGHFGQLSSGRVAVLVEVRDEGVNGGIFVG